MSVWISPDDLSKPNNTNYPNFKTIYPGVGAQSSSTLKSSLSAIFLHTNQQKILQGTLGTQDQCPRLSLVPQGTLHGP